MRDIRSVANEVKDDDDEYSYDDLDGVDLDSIPELSATLPASSAPGQTNQLTQDTLDNARQQGSSARALLSGDVEHGTNGTLSASTSTTYTGSSMSQPEDRERIATPSTDYGGGDDFDENFLKGLDNLESELRFRETQPTANVLTPTDLTATTSSCSKITTSQLLHAQGTSSEQKEAGAGSSSSQKRCLDEHEHGPTDDESEDIVAPAQASQEHENRSKRKMKQLMDGFEDEMSCPVCFDLFAYAYLIIPCGHSYCGDCGLGWITKNKDSPHCAVCRTSIKKRAPFMIANHTLDSAVQRHVDALRENGEEGWETGGAKLLEWTNRKE
ncbi:hypothetical protein BC835DRAFT_69477 [Cytidiella melzeri]|nr:hypothetical protein BC835DRAFT_69477 [Cytidiella melzeri]